MHDILQELVTSHEISNVCCVVRDPSNASILGYVTTTGSGQETNAATTGQSKNVAHVFTTDSDVSFPINTSKMSWPKLGAN